MNLGETVNYIKIVEICVYVCIYIYITPLLVPDEAHKGRKRV